MKSVKFILHSHITEELLDLIISVKSIAWPFSYEDQKKWIDKNIKYEDIHVLLFENDKPLAYLNLIKIDFHLDKDLISGYGIGNVCAAQKGMGWGKELMYGVNDYLKTNEQIGVLFCKEPLIKFYTENGWILITSNYLDFEMPNEQIYCMIYGIVELKSLRYNGNIF